MGQIMSESVKARLAEIRARHDAISQGKWSYSDDEYGDCWIRIPDGHDLYFGDMETTDPCCWQNAAFIAHAPDDISFLLDLISSCSNQK